MESFEYKLQKFDPGVVLVDGNNQVSSMNNVAFKLLGNIRGNPIGREVLQLHPEKSRSKLDLLLRAGSGTPGCPVASAPPMTMLINIPDRVLLIKVTKMMSESKVTGTCMMFYDLTDITTNYDDRAPPEGVPRQLLKLPVLLKNRVMLLDLSAVVHLQSDGHYTRVFTFDQEHFCNLTLSDLEVRLNPKYFVRTHRSHIINMQHAKTIEHHGGQYNVVLEMQRPTGVPISRARVGDVKSYLGIS